MKRNKYFSIIISLCFVFSIFVNPVLAAEKTVEEMQKEIQKQNEENEKQKEVITNLISQQQVNQQKNIPQQINGESVVTAINNPLPKYHVTNDDGQDVIVLPNPCYNVTNSNTCIYNSNNANEYIVQGNASAEVTASMLNQIQMQQDMTSTNKNKATNAILMSTVTALGASGVNNTTKAVMLFMAIQQANQMKSSAINDNKEKDIKEYVNKDSNKDSEKQNEITKSKKYAVENAKNSSQVDVNVIVMPKYPVITEDTTTDTEGNIITAPIKAKITANSKSPLITVDKITVKLPSGQTIEVKNGTEFIVEEHRTLGTKVFTYLIDGTASNSDGSVSKSGHVAKGSVKYIVSQYLNVLTSDNKATKNVSTYVLANGDAMIANGEKINSLFGVLGEATYDNGTCKYSISNADDGSSVGIQDENTTESDCLGQNAKAGKHVVIDNLGLKYNKDGDVVAFNDMGSSEIHSLSDEEYNDMWYSAKEEATSNEFETPVVAYNKETNEIKTQLMGVENRDWVKIADYSMPVTEIENADGTKSYTIGFKNGNIPVDLEKNLQKAGYTTGDFVAYKDSDGLVKIADKSGNIISGTSYEQSPAYMKSHATKSPDNKDSKSKVGTTIETSSGLSDSMGKNSNNNLIESIEENTSTAISITYNPLNNIANKIQNR